MLVPSKSTGFGMGAILLTEIKAYIELFGVRSLKLFLRCIRAMDSAYNKEANKKNKKG